jgi:probable RNA-binding protein EIF1AD
MPRPKRNLHATVEDTLTPPDVLSEGQSIAQITKAAGNNLYNAELPGGKAVLAELEAKFRSTIWIKRGSYVVVDTSTLADRDNKLDGEIVNVVRDEKQWRKMSYWCVQSIRGDIVWEKGNTVMLIHGQAQRVYKEVDIS